MPYTFSEVESALAGMYSIAPARRSPFSNRLRHLQKQGFPAGTNTGRGKAAQYEHEHVFQLAIVLMLNSFGYTPERAITLVDANRDNLAQGILKTLSASRQGLADEAVFCAFPPVGLSDLQAGTDIRAMSCQTLKEVNRSMSLVASYTSAQFTVSLFSMSGAITDLRRNLALQGNKPSLKFFYDDLSQWAMHVTQMAADTSVISQSVEPVAEVITERRDGNS